MHVEVSVRDRADGRFVPGLEIHATLNDNNGKQIGTLRQPYLWHPWLYPYGRNWKVPGDGAYQLRLHIAPPDFPRHDKINGRWFAEPVEVAEVAIETDRKKSRNDHSRRGPPGFAPRALLSRFEADKIRPRQTPA